VKELIEGARVDVRGNVSNSGATYDSGGPREVMNGQLRLM